MPEPNEIPIRIDITTLEADKQKVLEIFAELFAQLEKYDAKGIAPVRVEGLTELNSSVKATNAELAKLTQQLNNLNTAQKQLNVTASQSSRTTRENNRDTINEINSYDRLKQKLRELRNEYALLRDTAGKGHPLTQSALDDFSSLNKQINEIDNSLKSSSRSGVEQFGKGLTGAFSILRQMAYILPGIGIAGIFNLAFEAVSNLIGGLFSANQQFIKLRENSTEFNESLEKERSLLQEIEDLQKEINAWQNASYESQKKLTGEMQSFGFDNITISLYKMADATTKLQEATDKLKEEGGVDDVGKAYEAVTKKAQDNTDELKKNREELKKVNDFQRDYGKLQALGLSEADIRFYAKYGPAPGLKGKALQKELEITGLATKVAPLLDFPQFGSPERTEAYKKNLESQNAILEQETKKAVQTVNDYKNAMEEQGNAVRENQKLVEDEQRKTRETLAEDTKNEIQNRLRIEISAARSNQQTKLADTNAFYDEEIRVIKLRQAEEVANNSNNLEEIKRINDKAATDIKIANENRNKELLAINDNYALRNLEAVKQMNEAILQSQIDNNKAIIDDDKKSFNERLNALGNATQERIAIADLEFEHYKAVTGYINKTKDEQNAEDAKHNKNIQEILSSVPATIRGITSSFSNERIRQLDEENKAVDNSTTANKQYAIALHELNQRYLDGEITFTKYSQVKAKLEQFKVLALDDDQIGRFEARIEDDKRAVADFDEKIQKAALGLNIAQRKGDKNEIQAAEDKLRILQDGRDKANTKLDDDEDKLDAARLKKEEDLIKGKIKWWEYFKNYVKEIGDDLIDLGKQINDTQFEHEREHQERMIELIDKQYENEIDAIGRSSLAEKDKTALSIQLKAEEDRANEESQKKLRKIAHDKAVSDKAFAMTKIVWDTEMAIMGALANSDKLTPAGATAAAIAFGIMGAISLAKAAAAPVPALAFGTEDWRGGSALVGEIGREKITEPGKLSYYVDKPSLRYLPKHTTVVPEYSIPTISEGQHDNGWERTKWLAQQIKKDNKKTQQKIVNNISIDMGFETYKRRILYGNPSKI